jgi:hypothetical protein
VADRPYVRQNVFKSLDPKTGRPDIGEARKAGTGAKASRRFRQLVDDGGLDADSVRTPTWD